jgi:hypothetical protein
MGKGKDIDKCLSEIKGKEPNQFIDFNTFAPTPNELINTISPMKIISKQEYAEQENRLNRGELSDSEKIIGSQRYLSEEISIKYIIKFGANNWYDWNIKNWGCKWNAYHQFYSNNVIVFDTAWNTPFEAINKLSIKYPYLEFSVQYADEDFGQNVGEYSFINGYSFYETKLKNGSFEAMRMGIDILVDYEYYLYEVIIDIANDDDDSEYINSLIRIAHEKGCLNENYPPSVLNKLKNFALDDEQYERVIEIDNILKTKETVC